MNEMKDLELEQLQLNNKLKKVELEQIESMKGADLFSVKQQIIRRGIEVCISLCRINSGSEIKKLVEDKLKELIPELQSYK